MWISSFPLIITILYAGILLGVSFLATPVKFLSPLLTLPVALDVGKVTFHALIKLEWLLASIWLISFLFNSFYKLHYIFILTVFIILAMQTFWLLPILDIRIILIQLGQIPEKAHYHLIYIMADIIKIVVLLSSAILIIKCNWKANTA